MRDLEIVYHKVIKGMILICVLVGIAGFIHTNRTNANKGIIQVADLKEFILQDYTDTDTVYYKLLAENGELSVITWDSTEKPMVYRFKQKSNDELKFKMSFKSSAIDLVSLKESYNGVLK